uniref:Uncharacterized protein n=1 Tax=Syphacia muris TaxID=451379 RepID=A0A0N5ALJ5_9BILA
MSNFLRIFRSKKGEKENISLVNEERKSICRNSTAYGSTRKDRRSSLAVAFEDFVKPTAPYHTVTQPKQGGVNFGKRKYYESKITSEYPTLKDENYEDELLDSEDSFVSEEDRRSHYRNEVVRDLKEEVDYLKYRLRRESEKKLIYKEKLACEQRNVQKILNQRQRLEYDLNVYKTLLSNLRKERKMNQSKIAKLEAQLKSNGSRNNMSQHSFANNTFATTTSTSNELSSVDEVVMDLNGGAGEMLCSASELALPIQNTFHSIADSVDEVKNFRKDDTNSSFELARAEAETGIGKIDLDSTLLNDTAVEHLSNDNDCGVKSKLPLKNSEKPKPGEKCRTSNRTQPASCLRRSLSDTDMKKESKSVAFKMTNL